MHGLGHRADGAHGDIELLRVVGIRGESERGFPGAKNRGLDELAGLETEILLNGARGEGEGEGLDIMGFIDDAVDDGEVRQIDVFHRLTVHPGAGA